MKKIYIFNYMTGDSVADCEWTFADNEKEARENVESLWNDNGWNDPYPEVDNISIIDLKEYEK